MATLYLDRRDLKLELAPGRLRMRDADGGLKEFPLAMLERVVITARTQLDSALLGALGAAGVTVLFLNPRKLERIAFLVGRPHNDLSIRVAQFRRADDCQWLLVWARHLVRRKIMGHRQLLSDAESVRPRQRYALQRAIKTLDAAQDACSQAENPASLRGIEGAAASAFFGAYAALLPAALNFSGRNRRPPRDPVNVLLSLSYTLVHFEAVRAAYSGGLDPYLGYYHEPTFGRESMASDLLEPIRPAVDHFVWRLVADGYLRGEHFTQIGEACHLGKAGRGRFYGAFENFAFGPRRALRRQVRALVRVLRGREESLEHE